MTSGTHLVAAVVCVVSAAVMLVTVQQRHERIAHAIVLATTLVSAVSMDSTVAMVTCSTLLLATALILGHRRSRSSSGSSRCAVHLAGCAALTGLMTVPAVLDRTAHDRMAQSMGNAMHGHGSPAAGPGSHGAVLVPLVCGVVAIWWGARRLVGDTGSGSRRPRVERTAGWLMMAAMGFMAAG